MEKWLATIIRLILTQISPQIAELIKESLAKAKEAAAQTANPFDDILVDILIWLTSGK